MNNTTTLSINTAVLEKMAEIAAKEIEGVAGIAKKSIDLKNAIKTKTALKGVKVETINGAVKIIAYISVKEDASVKEVAQKVQQNIKEKIQTMTGTGVTQVDVIVADVDYNPEAQTEE